MKTGCAILAGGEATRFGGRFKPEIIVEGRRIIDRILDVISPLFSEIIIVSDKKILTGIDSKIFVTSDIFKKRGPLGGLHAALSASESDALFVVAGDMPFLEKEIIEQLCTYYNKMLPQALVPRHSGLIEPLHSIYSVELKYTLEKILSEPDNNSVTGLLDKIDTRYLDVKPSVAAKAFINLNTDKDMQYI